MRSALTLATLAALSMLLCASCKRSTPGHPDRPATETSAPAEDARLLRARTVVGQLKKNLKAALLGAVPKGPVQAIELCSTEAPAVRQKINTKGVTVGRSSHKLRNPENAPEPWLAPLLEQLRQAPRAAGAHRTVELPGGALGYVEPIYIGSVCLTCHGKSIPELVSAKLRDRYPKDQATGFELGQFRGVFWAKVTTP